MGLQLMTNDICSPSAGAHVLKDGAHVRGARNIDSVCSLDVARRGANCKRLALERRDEYKEVARYRDEGSTFRLSSLAAGLAVLLGIMPSSTFLLSRSLTF